MLVIYMCVCIKHSHVHCCVRCEKRKGEIGGRSARGSPGVEEPRVVVSLHFFPHQSFVVAFRPAELNTSYVGLIFLSHTQTHTNKAL